MPPLAVRALLVALAAALGVAVTGRLVLGADSLVADTPFSLGHLVAMGFGAGTVGPRVLPIAGGADFRPLLWPADLLAGVIGPGRALAAVFIGTPAWNAVCGLVLARALRLGPWAGFVLGAALAFGPQVHTTLANGQLEQAVLGGAALILAAGAATAEAGGVPTRVLGALGTGVLVFLVGAAAPHVALAGCAGLGAWGALDAATTRSRLPTWALLLAAAAAGALAAGAYHAPSFGGMVRLFAPFGSVDAAPVGGQVKRAVRLVDLLRPPDLPPRLARGVVHSGFLGWILPVGGLFAAIRLPRARLPFAAGLGCLVLAMGPGETIPLPYRLLESLSPTIAASGTPYRFALGAVVGFAAALACLPWGGRGASVVTVLLWIEGWKGDPRPLPLATEVVEHDPSTPILAAGTGPVLDLPVPGSQCVEGATHYLLEATAHGRPIPVVMRPSWEAWPAGAPRDFAHLVDTGLERCDPAAIAAIREAGYTTVVAHGHRDCNLSPKAEACLRASFGPGTAEGKVRWWEIGR